MRTKTAPTKKQDVSSTPLQDMVMTIQLGAKLGEKISHQDISERIGCHRNYIDRQLAVERGGAKISKKLLKRIEIAYEFILTGKITIEDKLEIFIKDLTESKTYMETAVEMLIEQVSELTFPQNPEHRKKVLSKFLKEEVGRRMGSVRP